MWAWSPRGPDNQGCTVNCYHTIYLPSALARGIYFCSTVSSCGFSYTLECNNYCGDFHYISYPYHAHVRVPASLYVGDPYHTSVMLYAQLMWVESSTSEHAREFARLRKRQQRERDPEASREQARMHQSFKSSWNSLVVYCAKHIILRNPSSPLNHFVSLSIYLTGSDHIHSLLIHYY